MESISSISFSNRTSRYLCSGGSGQVVRIWDLQRKRCIKWLKGHTSSISSSVYNCKDEHLASIGINGDLLVHNLASGAKSAELKDPHGQMLRVLDYSRASRNLLATAGDDGSVHLWDTLGRSPKVSWLKQHSAPTAGLSFSPSNDKIIATVGLDKKLYTFDSGAKRPSFCISFEVPFSSLAFREDGWVLAAGTGNGRVVFYDVRAKPQPFTVLHAYGQSEAVTSLCWQRSRPIDVDEKNCTVEIALLGGAVEDSVLMPDPLPSSTLSSVSLTTTLSGPRRSSSAVESAFAATFTNNNFSSLEETPPHRRSLRPVGVLPKLHAPRDYTFKDDMDVFSPLVDIQPITPSLDKLWNEANGSRKDQPGEKKISLFPTRKFTLPESVNDVHSIFDWKPGPSSKQDDVHSTQHVSIPNASSISDDSSSTTTPEAWGGDRPSDKFAHYHPMGTRFNMSTSSSTSSSVFIGLQDPSSSLSAMNYSTSVSLFSNLPAKDVSSGQENSPGTFGRVPFSALGNFGTKHVTGQIISEATGSLSLNSSRRPTYAERIGSSASFNDGVSLLGSPKTKKTGVETREERQNSLLTRSDTTYAVEHGLLSSINGAPNLNQRTPQADLQQGSSNFTLQLFQHTLQETLSSFQKSIHEDVRNLHIEILRQFHIQEMEVSGFTNTVTDKLTSLTEEIQDLKKENERLRQLL